MEEIKPMISTNEVLSGKYANRQEIGYSRNEFSHVSSTQHEFLISSNFKQFAKELNKIDKGKTYHYVSFGQFSLKHIVFHIISIIGACDIYATTYGLGPGAARGIVNAMNAGLIKSFNFLYDNKIKNYKIEAHDICSSNFPVKIANIHAKVCVMQNANYSVVITGSANWSDSNDKIEIAEITIDEGLANFHKNWIKRAMETNSTEAKKIYNEIQSTNT